MRELVTTPRSMVPIPALHKGAGIVIRNRLGLHRIRLRVVREGRGGRVYVVGHDSNGTCHSAWIDDVLTTGPRRPRKERNRRWN